MHFWQLKIGWLLERRELIKDKALTCTHIPEIMGYLQCLNDCKNRGSDSQNVIIIINVEYYFQIRKQFS